MCAYSRCCHAYITVACVLPWQVFQRWRLQSPEGRLSRDGYINSRRGLYSQAVLPKMPGASSFPRPAATVSQARWRDGNNFRGGATTGTSPREHYGRLLLLPLQDLLQTGRKCLRRRGLGRSSKDLNRRSCPTTPPGGVIDRMRQLEHSRVSRATPRAGPAMVARKCGPAKPYRGRGPAWAYNESSWAVLPENLA
jgi:hypothetical protein